MDVPLTRRARGRRSARRRAGAASEQCREAGADRLDYDPGLKFMRLVLAFMYFNEEEDKQFMDAVGADDVRTQEALLLAKCEYPYLSSRDIYEDWAKLFSEMIEEKPDAVDSILRIRYQACKLRLSEPGACVKKTIGTIVFQQIPCLY